MRLPLTAILCLVHCAVALADPSQLDGHYDAVTPDPNYDPLCSSFELNYDPIKNQIQRTDYYVDFDDPQMKCVPELGMIYPAINKGSIPWEYDWGDGVARGIQETSYFDTTKTLVHIIKVNPMGARRFTRKYELQGFSMKMTLEDWDLQNGSQATVNFYIKR